MSEKVKQEGEFKMAKKKATPRNLIKNNEVIKIDLSTPAKPAEEAEITKVIISNNAVQEQSTDESLLREEEPKVELQEVEQGNEEPTQVVIQEISKEEKKEVDKLESQLSESIKQNTDTGRKLPENIEKLVSFMEETGGTVEDYVRLNTDYSTIDEETLVREYYKKTKPYLDKDEIQFAIEDSFYYDEELDDDREIKKKKLAFKEEVQKAKGFLDSVKNKYYDEIKLKSNISPEKQQAIDFFNRYKEDQDKAKSRHERFKLDTAKMFGEDFKGFEFGIGEKRFRYGITNKEQVVEKQSDINNFLGKFLDKEGNVVDTNGYHKALYAAMNADKLAQHFYEQGKADAVKEVISDSKNPGLSQPRQAPKDVFVNGLKVKSVSGYDSSKLRIKTKKFN
jgi:hypothetical protein